MSPQHAGEKAAMALPVVNSLHEAFSPVVYSAVLALFAAYLSEVTGAEYGRGSTGPWHDSREGNAVRNSAIVLVQS
jgi:hypothetical protein